MDMHVVKRDGTHQAVNIDKVLRRISVLAKMQPALEHVDLLDIASDTIRGLFSGIQTSELDSLAASVAAYKTTHHPENAVLAGRIEVSNLQKKTPKTFSEAMTKLHQNINGHLKEPVALVSDKFMMAVNHNAAALDAAIDDSRDYVYDYFAIKTLMRGYLMANSNGQHVERPQYMWMRVAVAIHGTDLDAVLETYNMMSRRMFTHATPTLFNAGTNTQQLSSCFLLDIQDDSIKGIYKTITDCALISQQAGGIGVAVSKIRATKSYIRGSNSASNGIVPMLRVFDATARYVDQCHTGDTKVWCDREWKPFTELQVGDLIRSGSGKPTLIQKILKYVWNGPLLRINGTRVTPQHQVLGVCFPPDIRELSDSEAIAYVQHGMYVSEMHDASEFRVGDYLCMLPQAVPSQPGSDYVASSSGHRYLRVRSVVEEPYTGDVYDLEVDGDHTYVTELAVVHNGGGKRKGSFAMYLEPWHADIFQFLELRKNVGKDELRARDLFYGLWVPDLFMKRVEKDENWTLFCPKDVPKLLDTYGEEFEALYCAYEKVPDLSREVLPARKLMTAIIEAQIETGMPYMVYKDACNRKSNQKVPGHAIKSSNLCTEIIEFTDPTETAVCNLASIALPRYVTADGTFDHAELYRATQIVVRNLDKVIDRTYYFLPETKHSNSKYRPMGVGIQGLADLFIMLRFPFESAEAMNLNREIAETMYYAALDQSCQLAERHGVYPEYSNSPASKGLLQQDLWGRTSAESQRWNWKALRERIAQHGLRNSLLIALMPTAGTSQILGCNECFEPYTSNVYVRRVLAGEFVVLNQHLAKDLMDRGLWSPELANQVAANKGSVRSIPEVPNDLKQLYKTVWEISQKRLLEMSAERGVFICQSQSINVFMSKPDLNKMVSMHIYGWKLGLKTGQYYLRTHPATEAAKITITAPPAAPPAEPVPLASVSVEEPQACERGCVSCSG